MSISFSGNNLFQVGNATQQFVVTEEGALSFTKPATSNPANPLKIKNDAHRSLMEQSYGNLMQQAFAQLTKNSLDFQVHFETLFNNFNEARIATPFPNSGLAANLRAVAKTIALRPELELRRQTIFVGFGGWDHHQELLTTQAGMLTVLDGALTAFQKALEELGVSDDVITFTCSDFGRTLRSNGRGTDHAWGGNALVMGGPVNGGRIYGTFPNLALDSTEDVGYGGRLLPTTSVDQFFCEMLRWFGVTSGNMPAVLPNITNFYNPSSATLPIGFLRPGTWV